MPFLCMLFQIVIGRKIENTIPLLSEQQDGSDGDENGGDRVSDAVEEDGHGFHGAGVGEQQRHQQQVMALHNRQDLLGVGLLSRTASLCAHGQLHHIQGQETQR